MKNKNIQIDERLKKDANFILEQFTAVMDALSAGDDKQGQKIMDLLDPIRKGFDQYINAAISDETNTVCSAVVNSLFSRYLKRVGAHLENISSSIANPFDKIGFYKNKNKETEIE